SVGGMEQVVLRLACAQKEAGHRVSVVALKGGPLERAFSAAGVPVEILRSGKAGRAMGALRSFRAKKLDVIHAHNPTSLHYAALSKLVSRAPLIVTIHGDQDTHARLGSALEWRLAAAVVVVSHAAMRRLRLPCAAEKLSVVHNGVPSTGPAGMGREALRRDLGAGEAFLGTMVARIDGNKGHGTLLHGICLLRNAGMKVMVLVVGD